MTPGRAGAILFTLYRRKWNLLRLVLAAFILWAVASDTAARMARLRLAALPDFDYAMEAGRLREEGRFGEALVIADAGLAAGLADATAVTRLTAERERIAAEQSSWARRARDAGLGAISGQGTSLEGLVGAVAADLFIVGDIRDLVVQGGKLAIDGETDPVILALSAVGIATTLAPEIDWVPSMLKVARKAGTLSTRLGESMVSALRRGGRSGETLLADLGTIGRAASPGGTVRLLRHVDDADELAAVAAFLKREPTGAFTLFVTGREGVQAVVRAAGSGAAEAASLAALKSAARKGPEGVRWWRSVGRTAARPHVLVGLAKGVYKGNVEALAARIAERFDPHGWWAVPAAAAWVMLELWWLVRAFAVSGQRGVEARRYA